MSTTVLCCNVIGICIISKPVSCTYIKYSIFTFFYIINEVTYSIIFILYSIFKTVYLFFIYCTVDCVIGLVCRSVCTVAYSNNLYTVQHCNYLINPFVLITSTLFLLYCVLVLCYLLNLPFYKRKLSK